MLKPIQVDVQRCTDLGQITETPACVEASACTRTASGLGQQPCAESGRLGGSAYLCSGSPGVSLGVSETEGLDKEMAGTTSVAGLSAGVLTGQLQAGTSLAPPRGQWNKGTLRVS